MPRYWKRPLITMALWIGAFVGVYAGYSWFEGQPYAQAQERRATAAQQGTSAVHDIATAFRDIGRTVEPSVVNIEVHKRVPGVRRMPFDEDMLRRFFRDQGVPNGDDEGDEGTPDVRPPRNAPQPPGDDEMPEQIGTGSGVIMEVTGSKGYVLTNNHVAGGAEAMIITLADGRKIRNGKLLGADAKTDLAVVAIEADNLVPAKWGDSDQLQKGDWILAFGSPFGYVGSMTHGIVSALKRQPGILGSTGYENFIQVDAPINPGNSGGPLVNLRGEVVGVNTAIASRTGGFQGIGFAIPSNQAKFVYNALKTKGKVVRGWLGVGINDVAKDVQLARSFGYNGNTGVLVDQIIPGTPAATKLQRGDIITQVNGKPVEDTQQLRNAVAAMAPGTQVDMTVFRGGKTQQVSITLGEQPENPALARGGTPGGREPGGRTTPGTSAALGVRVQTLNPDMAERLGLESNTGAIITAVTPNSVASKAGLRRGDVITEVGATPVKTADEFVAAMKNVDLKKGVRMYVVSREGSRYMFLSTTGEQP